jgi:hypothetical protein
MQRLYKRCRAATENVAAPRPKTLRRRNRKRCRTITNPTIIDLVIFLVEQ